MLRDTFRRNDDTIDENDTFFNKKMTQSTKMTHFSKKDDTFFKKITHFCHPSLDF